MKSTIKRVIELQDWDTLVRNTYGKPYMFQQQEGCKSRGMFPLTIPPDKYELEEEENMNDSIPDETNGEEMGVKFQVWLERDPSQIPEHFRDSWGNDLFWERNFYPNIYTIANDLYKKGLIEAGEYLINIDW